MIVPRRKFCTPFIGLQRSLRHTVLSWGRRMSHIPDAARIIKEQNLGRLHESAWLENVMEFLKDDGEIE